MSAQGQGEPGRAMPISDLDAIVDQIGASWDQLRGQRLLVTGGTGIIGKWLLESLLRANRRLQLNTQAVVLSRRPRQFAADYPQLAADPSITLIEGDVRSFELGRAERVSHVIHGATDVVAQTPPAQVLDTCVQGTARVLAEARRSGASRMLLLSSGAVYGKTPASLARIPEDYSGAPDCQLGSAAYGEGKRCAELLCAMAGEEGQLTIPVARCFAMVGPHLPLDKHFAIGNFIDAAMRGDCVNINGDGTPMRSYLHAVDVTSWLWALLFRGRGQRAYNVGSEDAVSIEGLARRVVAALGSSSAIKLARALTPGAHAQVYVPSTSRIAEELGMGQTIGLEEAIRRTAAWHRAQSYEGIYR